MGSKARFKVGDRVRFTDECHSSWWFGPHTENKEGVIDGQDSTFGYRWSVKVGDRYGYVDDDHIEPATPAAPSDTTGYTVPLCAFEDEPKRGEPDTELLVSISADTSALDAEIDRALKRLRKLKKKARKMGVSLEFSELQDAA